MIHVEGENGILEIEGDHSTTMAEITVVLRKVIQEMLEEWGDMKTKMSLYHLIRVAYMDDESIEKEKNMLYEFIKKNGN